MFESITNTKDRGQVGIGTLIVFIAMVLVAAIAAGVLINTAGFLQTQAEATGEDSTDLVSERIDVTSEVGIVAADETSLEEIRLTVSGAPGADDIDLADTTLQAVGPGGQENLVFTDQPTTENELVAADVNGDTDVADGSSDFDIEVNHDNIENNDDPITVSVTLDGTTETFDTDGTTQGETLTVNADSTGGDINLDAGGTFTSGDQIDISLNNAEMDELSATEEVDDGESTQLTTTETVDQTQEISNLDGNEFAVDDPDGDFESSPVLNSENQYTILINPSAGAFNDGTFSEGDTATVDIVSPAGATTTVELRAPDLFSEEGEAVQL